MPGVRLHVGVLGAEELAGVLGGERLDGVDVAAAGVEAAADGALGVLVAEPVAHRQQHGRGGVVLAGDQLEHVALVGDLPADGVGDARLDGPDDVERAAEGDGLGGEGLWHDGLRTWRAAFTGRPRRTALGCRGFPSARRRTPQTARSRRGRGSGRAPGTSRRGCRSPMVGPIPARQSRPRRQPTGRAGSAGSPVHHASGGRKETTDPPPAGRRTEVRRHHGRFGDDAGVHRLGRRAQRAQLPPAARRRRDGGGRVDDGRRGAPLPRHARRVLGAQLRPRQPAADRRGQGPARPGDADLAGVPPRPVRASSAGSWPSCAAWRWCCR